MERREQTLVVLKPDAIQRGLTGEIIKRYEQRGLQIAAMKMDHWTKNQGEEWYAGLKDKPFFNNLVSYITSNPIGIFVFESSENTFQIVRDTTGATDPQKAAPGTIRADLALNIGRNLVHASDSAESALREIAFCFPNKADVFIYNKVLEPYITEPTSPLKSTK
jgi:nucleoside-diphosphate kinase